MGWFRKLVERRAEQKAERRAYVLGRQVVTQGLMEQQALSARMGIKLHGDYMALRNALAGGTYVPNHDDPTADQLLMFRAGRGSSSIPRTNSPRSTCSRATT